jgi:2-methylcitrate dehydratase PrpD
VAIALAKDIGNPYVYSEETLWDKEVRELAKRVEAVIDPRFAEFRATNPHGEVIIEMNGGERHVIQIAGFKGLPATPFNFDDACAKLRSYAAPIIDKKRTEEIIAKVRSLENLTDMADIARLMGA